MGKYLVLHPALPYDESLFGIEGGKGVVCELGKRRLSQTPVQTGSGGAKKNPGAGDKTENGLFSFAKHFLSLCYLYFSAPFLYFLPPVPSF